MESSLWPEVVLADATGELLYWRRVWADSLLSSLDHTISWRQDSFRIYGREHPLPRLTAWYGDPGAIYRYSGIVNEPQPWTPLLLEIKARVEQIVGQEFNSVLANRYAHGGQHQGYHADDEVELGVKPCIASVSFGATRRFRVLARDKSRSFALDLEDGSLLVMRGAMQEHYVHALSKTAKPVGLRINLTFRQIFKG